jgi:filamentous hemagglutinin family protein
MGYGVTRIGVCEGVASCRYPFAAIGIILAWTTGWSPVAAQPAGGTVIAGQAAISAPNAATTLITQSSQKAIINWQSFSVAGGGLVQFAQPNSSAITLNRVTGLAASAIDGAIRANGQVWLINPNGVLFGQGAQVNVAGLLATTSDIADGDFLSGNNNFSGSSNAAVVNNGTIHARKGGSVVLSGASVANGGLIEARAGHVVLGSADAFTVDFKGDHLLSYQVTQPVARQTTDVNGNRVTFAFAITNPVSSKRLNAKCV